MQPQTYPEDVCSQESPRQSFTKVDAMNKKDSAVTGGDTPERKSCANHSAKVWGWGKPVISNQHKSCWFEPFIEPLQGGSHCIKSTPFLPLSSTSWELAKCHHHQMTEEEIWALRGEVTGLQFKVAILTGQGWVPLRGRSHTTFRISVFIWRQLTALEGYCFPITFISPWSIVIIILTLLLSP